MTTTTQNCKDNCKPINLKLEQLEFNQPLWNWFVQGALWRILPKTTTKTKTKQKTKTKLLNGGKTLCCNASQLHTPHTPQYHPPPTHTHTNTHTQQTYNIYIPMHTDQQEVYTSLVWQDYKVLSKNLIAFFSQQYPCGDKGGDIRQQSCNTVKGWCMVL